MDFLVNPQITKVEPPFWFFGMKNPELQLMFYGPQISEFEVSTNFDCITKIVKTENPNYLFITINTHKLTESILPFYFKKEQEIVFIQKYEFKKRRENSANRKGFDAADVVYLIMPDRFANGNDQNNSSENTTEKYNRDLPAGRHGGDIEGIIKNLDYIQSLGATAIWSTPLCEDNDADFSYHTYAQSDVYKIDPRYGSNADYLRLAQEMHQRNLKLIMDYVTNHWGITHWMIQDLPTPEWIHQFKEYTETHHKRSVINDIHASQKDLEICLKGWFVPSMPDLNLENPLVLNYIKQNAIWWIEFADLDGFRVDTYNYSEPQAMANWTKAITAEYPNFNIVGEIWMPQTAQIAYWQKDSQIGALRQYNSNLPTVMDFPLMEAISKAFNEGYSNGDTGVMRLYDHFSNDFLYPNSNNILIFGENHDTQRLNQLFGNDIRKYKLTMTLLATVRGIPQLYYGSEIGMDGDKNNGDADIRKDFPGGWPNDPQNAFIASGRTEQQNQYFDFTSQLFNWRKTNNAIHSGKMTHYIPENNLYVYFRYTATQTVMVLLNNQDELQSITTQRFAENIQHYSLGRDILSNQLIDITHQILLEPKSSLILELA
ncbi:glycoside hydrolase family 13 protein [Flavobacterium agrisoli]|uniref:Glycoside hydrolase family 13 protein n=1 Tax=Flavobacterium agrisoli TaxID=2793066 RepID=A0A934PQ61_9FLAO|nr:glycoside hydrolase family 13 protein [Flavobacterium agrisoli]MBK0370588.1 glycoside hydrolase family 13 protein [Flavobacterium agrisoli]